MTVDNVTQVINKIEGDKWKVMGRSDIDIVPYHQLEEIQRRYFTDTENTHACADYYVNCHPDASWKHLTKELYYVCLLYTSPSPRDATLSRMPSSA